jgi:glutaminyl-tRNA synthetase
VLGLYQPYIWEYSRLNVTNTMMSKRKMSENMSVEIIKKCYLIMLLYYFSIMIEYDIFLQLNQLVINRWVDGWDDPCLMTLAGLCHRGVTSTAINAFIRGIGITRRFDVLYMGIPKNMENI